MLYHITHTSVDFGIWKWYVTTSGYLNLFSLFIHFLFILSLPYSWHHILHDKRYLLLSMYFKYMTKNKIHPNGNFYWLHYFLLCSKYCPQIKFHIQLCYDLHEDQKEKEKEQWKIFKIVLITYIFLSFHVVYG